MDERSDNHFLSSSFTDLMASLAVIFILLTVVFIKSAGDSSKREKEAVQNGLSTVLEKNHLPLDQDPNDPLTLSVRVGEDVLNFSVNSDKLSPAASQFLERFTPELAQELCTPEVQSKVDAIVIEGHTDKSGEEAPEGTPHNIRLSQARSFSVLSKTLAALKSTPVLHNCILKLALASGRGSSSPIWFHGEYNADLSRRVEIKIRVKSSEQKFFKKLRSSSLHLEKRKEEIGR